jgi:hypothetical protein
MCSPRYGRPATGGVPGSLQRCHTGTAFWTGRRSTGCWYGHTELQRLNGELGIAEQLAELLRPLLAAVTRPGDAQPIRPLIVDVLAVAGVLAVEPWVHRRWYPEPR